MVAAVVSGLMAVLLGGGIMYVLLRGALQRTPAGVVKSLRRSGGEHRVRVPRWPAPSGTWNPAKPLGLNNAIFEPGMGVYRLAGDDTVHLDWTPRSGSLHEYVGAIPDKIEPGSLHLRRTHRIGGAIVGGYLAAVIIGFVLGYGLSSGRVSIRLGWGAGGVAIAMIGVWAVTLIVNVAHGPPNSARPSLEQDDS